MKKIHVLNYIWTPTEKPQNNILFYIAAGHRYFNSSIKTTPLRLVLVVPILKGVKPSLLSFSGLNQGQV